MKPKKWKVVLYIVDDGTDGFLDAQTIGVYLAVGLDRFQAQGLKISKPTVQELKA